MTQTHINIAMLAHVDAGKTTLSEALLYKSGSIRKAGRVDNKDAFLDTNEMERNRGITIFSKQAVFSYGGCEFTLLDTPGHVDFSAEMERTLQVLDYAVLIISGADGVQGHTRTLWRLLARYDIPTFIFVNKMDQLGTDHEKLLDQIKDTLSSACVDFSKNEDGTYRDMDFYENVAVCNEKVLEAYLEGGSIEEESVREMIQKRELFPCFFGSALKMEGIEELLFALSEYTKMPEYQEKFGATVFKITRDAQGSRLTHLKVTGGVLKARNLLSGHKQNKAEDIWEEKINQIRIYSGEKYETKDEVQVGDTEPDLEGVIGTTLYYKGFSFSAHLRYSLGGDVFNEALYTKVENISEDNLKYNQDKRALYDRWEKPGQHARFKGISLTETTQMSSRFVQRSNFLKGESFSAGYDFPKEWIEKAGFSALRLQVNMNDVFRISSVKEERGIEYPFARMVSASVSVTF